MELKAPGNLFYIIGETYNELGGSEYYKLKGFLGANVPKVKGAKAKRTFERLLKLLIEGLVKSCHDLSEGGLAVAAAEMAFASGYGLEIDLCKVPRKEVERNDFALFSESNSRFLIEVAEADKEDFETLIKGKNCALIGKVTKEPKLLIVGLNGKNAIDASLENLRHSWKKTLNQEESPQ